MFIFPRATSDAQRTTVEMCGTAQPACHLQPTLLLLATTRSVICSLVGISRNYLLLTRVEGMRAGPNDDVNLLQVFIAASICAAIPENQYSGSPNVVIIGGFI